MVIKSRGNMTEPNNEKTSNLRILMVTDYYLPQMGGGTRYVHEVSKRLAKRGHEVHILTPKWENQSKNEEIINGIKVFRHNVTDLPILRYWTQIFNVRRYFKRLVQNVSYDLIVFYQFTSALGIVLDRKALNDAKTVWTFFGPPHKEMNLELSNTPFPCQYFVLEWLYKKIFLKVEIAFAKKSTQFELGMCDKVVVLSSYAKKELMELIPGLSESRICLIPAGVDIGQFGPANVSKIKTRQQLGLPEDRLILLTVRRLVPRMGLENLIRSIPFISIEHKNILLVIGGRGFLKDRLQKLVAGLEIRHYVVFAGFIPDPKLPIFYQAADLFVLPTLALEGFGFPPLEAMACGTPALVTPVGASPEIMKKFDPQMITKGTDPQEIADSINAFIRDRNRTALSSSRCRNFVINNYSWDKAVSQLEKEYVELCGRREE
ncbi:MAG TPA: glycosyltransferase family 1 protein [Candidatus Scalindua sp.]|nr:glycosyltransferase family 1 protein [Candidatus Scalindua sp.]